MSELKDIFREKITEFHTWITLPDEHYYYYDDGRDEDPDSLKEHLFDRYALLVNFESISKIALGNELTPELFKVHMEKKILTSIKTALDGDPSINKWFPGNTGWKPLDQLLTLHRLKELKSVGITRRGGRGKSKTFDVSTLAATYFGKQILNGLNMGRRRSLDQKELDLLKAECAKLKLTLPEIIEPTTTERFFAPAENSN